jgi:hypothetical protein
MRLSDLLGCEVVAADGSVVGHVADIHLTRAGPELEGFGPSYVLDELRVAARRRGNLFGYDRADAGGPAVVRWLFRRLHRGDRFIRWEDMAAVDGRTIRLRVGVGSAVDQP